MRGQRVLHRVEIPITEDVERVRALAYRVEDAVHRLESLIGADATGLSIYLAAQTCRPTPTLIVELTKGGAPQ